jgi:hypothetical protein
MAWKTDEIDAAIAGAQEVLAPPAFDAKFGAGNYLKIATLVPSALRARRNPDGASLEDLLSPGVYARWTTLKRRYIGADEKIEHYRPDEASITLYGQAIEHAGLTTSIIWPAVVAAAKRHRVGITSTTVKVKLDIDRKRYKAGIKEYAARSGDDIACFTRTLERVEPDLELMKVRANAWATGDVGTLRDSIGDDLRAPCIAVQKAALAFEQDQGPDIRRKVDGAWLAAAERALATNRGTFAVLPMNQVLGTDGYLASLRAKGYAVHAPDEEVRGDLAIPASINP